MEGINRSSSRYPLRFSSAYGYLKAEEKQGGSGGKADRCFLVLPSYFLALLSEISVRSARTDEETDGATHSSVEVLFFLCQREYELQASSLVVLGRDRSAVDDNGILHDGQSEPGSAQFARPSFVHPVETFEQTVQMLR